MHNDDRPVGRLLNRREALALFGASATASLAPRASAQTAPESRVLETPDCVAQPEQTEGPYFVDTALERSDIRFDPATATVSAGAPLALHFVLSKVTSGGGCAVLPRAQVHIWQCDATGRYFGCGRPHDRHARPPVPAWLSGQRRGRVSFVSRRFTRAGIADVPCTFTSRCARPGRTAASTSSRRSCTSLTI